MIMRDDLMGMNFDNIGKWTNRRLNTGGLVYVAGDLFSVATIGQRIKEGELLKKSVPYSVFNPITDNAANDKVNTYAPATDVFSGDTEIILASDKFFMELDREDAGVMAELGVCYATNFLMNQLSEAVENFDYHKDGDLLAEDLKKMIKTYPQKDVIAHYSDIRFDSANKYNIPTAGVNHYVLGMLDSMDATIVRSPEEGVKHIKEEFAALAKGEEVKNSTHPKLNGEPIE